MTEDDLQNLLSQMSIVPVDSTDLNRTAFYIPELSAMKYFLESELSCDVVNGGLEPGYGYAK